MAVDIEHPLIGLEQGAGRILAMHLTVHVDETRHFLKFFAADLLALAVEIGVVVHGDQRAVGDEILGHNAVTQRGGGEKLNLARRGGLRDFGHAAVAMNVAEIDSQHGEGQARFQAQRVISPRAAGNDLFQLD